MLYFLITLKSTFKSWGPFTTDICSDFQMESYTKSWLSGTAAFGLVHGIADGGMSSICIIDKHLPPYPRFTEPREPEPRERAFLPLHLSADPIDSMRVKPQLALSTPLGELA
jgi:hypothetical protein